MRNIREERRESEAVAGPFGSAAATPWWTQPEWEARFPWLVQGTTARSPLEHSGDFALFREAGAPSPRESWVAFAQGLGFSTVIHARQVHKSTILWHDDTPTGLVLGPDADGHLTSGSGILMAVTVADCVPVFLLDESGRGGGVLHAGWRGVAAGILEAGIAMMVDRLGARRRDLAVHLGPSICGGCYEVGPEVHQALGLPIPKAPTPVDLRELLAARAVAAGMHEGQVTRSTYCTRCGGSPFFSHRGGDRERQIGFLGFRELPGQV